MIVFYYRSPKQRTLYKQTFKQPLSAATWSSVLQMDHIGKQVFLAPFKLKTIYCLGLVYLSFQSVSKNKRLATNSFDWT